MFIFHSFRSLYCILWIYFFFNYLIIFYKKQNILRKREDGRYNLGVGSKGSPSNKRLEKHFPVDNNSRKFVITKESPVIITPPRSCKLYISPRELKRRVLISYHQTCSDFFQPNVPQQSARCTIPLSWCLLEHIPCQKNFQVATLWSQPLTSKIFIRADHSVIVKGQWRNKWSKFSVYSRQRPQAKGKRAQFLHFLYTIFYIFKPLWAMDHKNKTFTYFLGEFELVQMALMRG